MRRILPMALALCTGCAGIGPSGLGASTPIRAQFDPRLDFPVTRAAEATLVTDPLPNRSSEETGPEGPRAPGPLDYDERDAKLDKVSPGLFWTGMILGLVGTAAATAFMVDGYVTEAKIEDGYGGSFSRAERDQLQDRGDRDNTLAGVGVGVGVVGFSLAIIMAGIDYTRCGPVTRRRKCERLADR